MRIFRDFYDFEVTFSKKNYSIIDFLWKIKSLNRFKLIHDTFKKDMFINCEEKKAVFGSSGIYRKTSFFKTCRDSQIASKMKAF